jgi:hypothetical protein
MFVPLRSLVKQTFERFQNMAKSFSLALRIEGRHSNFYQEYGKNSDSTIFITTYQSAIADDSILNLPEGQRVLIFYDESHRLKHGQQSYTSLYENFPSGNFTRICLTATPNEDQLNGKLCGEHIIKDSMLPFYIDQGVTTMVSDTEGQERPLLAPYKFTVFVTKPGQDMKENVDNQMLLINRLMAAPFNCGSIVCRISLTHPCDQLYSRLLKDSRFAGRIFKMYEASEADRTHVLDNFGDAPSPKMLIMCMAGTEGLDLPSLDAVVNFNKSLSVNGSLPAQLLGRILRPQPGKNGHSGYFVMHCSDATNVGGFNHVRDVVEHLKKHDRRLFDVEYGKLKRDFFTTLLALGASPDKRERVHKALWLLVGQSGPDSPPCTDAPSPVSSPRIPNASISSCLDSSLPTYNVFYDDPERMSMAQLFECIADWDETFTGPGGVYLIKEVPVNSGADVHFKIGRSKYRDGTGGDVRAKQLQTGNARAINAEIFLNFSDAPAAESAIREHLLFKSFRTFTRPHFRPGYDGGGTEWLVVPATNAEDFVEAVRYIMNLVQSDINAADDIVQFGSLLNAGSSANYDPVESTDNSDNHDAIAPSDSSSSSLSLPDLRERLCVLQGTWAGIGGVYLMRENFPGDGQPIHFKIGRSKYRGGTGGDVRAKQLQTGNARAINVEHFLDFSDAPAAESAIREHLLFKGFRTFTRPHFFPGYDGGGTEWLIVPAPYAQDFVEAVRYIMNLVQDDINAADDIVEFGILLNAGSSANYDPFESTDNSDNHDAIAPSDSSSSSSHQNMT